LLVSAIAGACCDESSLEVSHEVSIIALDPELQII
jgi:hypothetical protein